MIFFKRLVATVILAAAFQAMAYIAYSVVYWEADWLKDIAKWTPLERGILVATVAFLCWFATTIAFYVIPMKPRKRKRGVLPSKPLKIPMPPRTVGGRQPAPSPSDTPRGDPPSGGSSGNYIPPTSPTTPEMGPPPKPRKQ